ncbi:LysR family transcriptional regulator [Nonomuraea terrae]|uniref:LysR family transcriptional regulator n=1 Tax=Nonomuraea terrae TaxID=2530383 RepID=A0A4R4YZY6_9ACTN|nr:LysR family transcriptional regulator [Nonomuraea terrae]TDD49312.1 LysR family transcriptional regulator [Nonomuraea terrae]
MLDVRRLRVLLAVAEHGGIAAAARALTFTPPAVSQHIAALERQVGMLLVDRSGRTARLTAAGHRLAGHARQVLAGLEAAEADLASLDGDLRGTLAVGTIATLGRTLLPAALTTLRTTAPDVDLRIEECEPEDSLPALARGDLDVVLAGEYGLTPQRPQAHIDRIDLFTEPLLIAVACDHPLRGPDVDLAQLRDERWIAPAAGSSCETMLQRICALAGFEPHVVAHSGDFTVAAALVSAGHGITLLPAIATPPTSGDATGVKLLGVHQPGIHRTLYAAIRQGTRQHPLVNCVLDALTTSAERFPASHGETCPVSLGA